MFKKLLSNLPFNPSLIGEVAFYARRLHQEAALRRAGLILLSFSIVIQLVAVASPPQPSMASSTSDMMVGGFSRKSEVVQYCQNNTRNYKKIAAHYGITCEDIQQATETRIAPRDYNGRLHSMGRLSYGTEGEIPVSIPGVGTVYLRHFWSLNHDSSYRALKGKTSYGMTFFVLFDCGNLIFIGVPQPPEKCKWDKSISKDSPKCFEPCPVKGKQDIPKSSPKCFVPCPVKGKQDIPKSSDKCFEPCPYNKKIPAKDDRCFEPCPVDGKKSIPKDDINCFEPCKYNPAIAKTDEDCFEPCKYNSEISKNDAECKPCEASQTKSDKTACIVYSKSATNKTQNLPDANGTTAQAGDVIAYNLTTKNDGKADIKGFVVNENISDVLDYADIVDLGGATRGEEGVISWPAETIKAGASSTHTFTVRIKSPIPNTPVSTSDAAHFDMTLTNVYGNAVNIKLPPSVIKSTEIITTTLPNTGPGTSLAIAAMVTVFVSYFFARSRLLAKELDIIKAEYATGGF